MTDRLLVFSNPEVQKLLHEKFIPVAANDWYQRRRQDAEGEFFRSVANQGPRKGQGGSTRQGHYVLTAGGKLLGYNNNRGPEKRLKMMHDALKKWSQLPTSDKTVQVPAFTKPDLKFHRALPEAGTVIKVYSRALEDNNGKLTAMIEQQTGSMAAVDHLWLKKEEVAQLHKLIKGGGGAFPGWLAYRLTRHHLVDSTRGEPPHWKRDEVKKILFRIDKAGSISGSFHLQTKDNGRGFMGKSHGRIQYDAHGKLKTFELLVIGQHWGEGRYTKGARPGITPLGFVFQLSDSKKAQDSIPPQGMSWERGYWESEK